MAQSACSSRPRLLTLIATVMVLVAYGVLYRTLAAFVALGWPGSPFGQWSASALTRWGRPALDAHTVAPRDLLGGL